MTVNAVRRRGKVAKLREDEPQPKPQAIGEVDANIVDCPVCKRPLDRSAGRCPGCRTRFVAGVQLSKASVLISMGLAAGLSIGGGVVALTAPRTPAQAPATTVPAATVAPAPTTGVIPTPAATVVHVDPGVPAAATAALRGTATVNARITTVAQPLAAELAAPDLDAQEVARIMRRLNFEAGTAQALLPSLATWPSANALRTELATFYADVRAIATQTLASSVRNEAAYEHGARAMVQRLAGLAALDQASRDLAATVQLELPTVATVP